MKELTTILMFCRALINSGAPSSLTEKATRQLADKLGCTDFRLSIAMDACTASAQGADAVVRVQIEDKTSALSGGNFFVLGKLLSWLMQLDIRESSCAQLQAELKQITACTSIYPSLVYHLSAGIGSATVGFAFGAGWKDLLLIFVAAFLADCLQAVLTRRTALLPLVRTLIAIIFGGVIAAALTVCLGSAHYFINITAALIFFMPGLPIVSGILELLRGNNAIGIYRFTQAALTIGLIAIGEALAMLIIPEDIAVTKAISASAQFPLWLSQILGCFSTAILAVALTLYFSIDRRYAFVYAGGGFLVQLVNVFATNILSVSGYVATFIALVVLTLYAYYYKAALGCVYDECVVPPYYVAAMIAIALFPGVGIIRTVDGMVRIARSTISSLPASLVTETVYYASSTAVSLVALVFGIVIVASVFTED